MNSPAKLPSCQKCFVLLFLKIGFKVLVWVKWLTWKPCFIEFGHLTYPIQTLILLREISHVLLIIHFQSSKCKIHLISTWHYYLSQKRNRVYDTCQQSALLLLLEKICVLTTWEKLKLNVHTALKLILIGFSSYLLLLVLFLL